MFPVSQSRHESGDTVINGRPGLIKLFNELCVLLGLHCQNLGQVVNMCLSLVQLFTEMRDFRFHLVNEIRVIGMLDTCLVNCLVSVLLKLDTPASVNLKALSPSLTYLWSMNQTSLDTGKTFKPNPSWNTSRTINPSGHGNTTP